VQQRPKPRKRSPPGKGTEKGWEWGEHCSCNPRSCRAVVEKTGQQPPVGAPPHRTTTGEWWRPRNGARSKKPRPGLVNSRLPGEKPGGTPAYIYIYIYVYIIQSDFWLKSRERGGEERSPPIKSESGGEASQSKLGVWGAQLPDIMEV